MEQLDISQQLAPYKDEFEIANGLKQSCVLAPLLFILFYTAVICEVTQSSSAGIYVHFHTDGKLFNLSRLRAKSRTLEELIQELLYADNCAFFATSEDELQDLSSKFASAVKTSG